MRGEPLAEWGHILKNTIIGRFYVIELLLSISAPLLPLMGLAVRLLWAVIAISVESFSGHAAAFDTAAYTIGLNFVHLTAASLWSAGLVLLLSVWIKDRPEAGRFALIFSKWSDPLIY